MSEYGPCGTWGAHWTCDISTVDPADLTTAQEFATAIVWALSGRQFGLCTETLRPCRYDCWEAPWPWDSSWAQWPGTWSQWPNPALIGGLWFNLACGACPGRCTCAKLSEVRLPAPINSIVEVKIDGVVLDTTAYQLLDRRTLVRTDGGEWPRCNDLSRSDDEADTWSITAAFGQPPPEGADLAVGELGCQILKAMREAEDCRLPPGVTQLARQGVTIQFPDVSELFREGRTGLYLVDAFVATWNPHGLKRRAGTYSIDRQPATRVTPIGP